MCNLTKKHLLYTYIMEVHQDLNEEIINQIGDLFAAFQWLQKLSIESKGVSDLEGAKCRLLQYVQERQGADGFTRTSNVSTSTYMHIIDYLYSFAYM